MGTRGQALGLYRRILRAARTWPGPQEEVEYIRVSHKACLPSDSNLARSPFYTICQFAVSFDRASRIEDCVSYTVTGMSINVGKDVGLD
jgi:hypothetical protein